jgi:aspartate aminotransferase
MSYSHLASSIAESPTLRLNEEAQLLLGRGEPVIHLGIGEPKNKAPISAILSSAAKLSTGDVKYSPTDGIPSLKKAIIRYTEENYDKLVEPENIIVSSGAKQSIFNLLYALLNPLDEVIILAPYWVSYPEMVKMVNGVPVIVTPEDGGLHPRMEDIEEAVSASTKAIIVNSPNNPSGLVFSDTFVEEIVQFCERKKIFLIMDDIYHKLVFDNRRAAPCYAFTRENTGADNLMRVCDFAGRG